MKARAILPLALACLWLVLVGPAASASAYPATACPTLALSTTNPSAGESVSATGANFASHAKVRLELDSSAHVLANVTTDGSGSFSTTFRLPGGLTGPHSVVAVGGDVAGAVGCPGDPIQTVNIQAPNTSNGGPPSTGGPGTTAFTGLDVLGLIAAAAALIATGVLLNRRGRKERVAASRY